nr:MAG TPA: hypothetical protein [Bacteriophage sp.]
MRIKSKYGLKGPRIPVRIRGFFMRIERRGPWKVPKWR